MHNLSAHIPLTSTLGGSRGLLFNTPRSTLEVLTPRGLPSTQVRLDEQKPSPEQVMVDITVLVAGHTMCSTETKVNDSE